MPQALFSPSMDHDTSHASSPSPPRGNSVVYMLRTTQQHHVALSSLADQKASFLLAAAVVLLGIVLSQILKGSAPVALFILGATSLVTTLMASMALMPRTSKKKSRAVQPNVLFFGHFTEMSEEEYLDKMRRIFTSDDAVFEAMARDIYQMGTVLRWKKFRYLGLCYTTFVTGVAITCVTAVAEYLM